MSLANDVWLSTLNQLPERENISQTVRRVERCSSAPDCNLILKACGNAEGNWRQKWIACMKEQRCSHQFAGPLRPPGKPEHTEGVRFRFLSPALTWTPFSPPRVKSFKTYLCALLLWRVASLVFILFIFFAHFTAVSVRTPAPSEGLWGTVKIIRGWLDV